MKKSNYNYLKSINSNEAILYNTLTNALSIVDKKKQLFLKNDEFLYQNLDSYWKNIVDKMIENGYIIDDDVDEFKMLELQHNTIKYDSNQLSLVIAPTLDCNFSCPYCFENRVNGRMSKKVQDKIIRYINNLSKVSVINVTWYGGEPTICFDIIKELTARINNIAQEKGLLVNYSMITNGYLINEDMVKEFNIIGIKKLQITLDGPKNIHDSRRCLRDGGSTYEKIVKNIRLLQKNNIYVGIRVNVDYNNHNFICNLIEDLKEKNIDISGLYLAHVDAMNDKKEKISSLCLKPEEFMELSFKFSKMIALKGKDYMRNIYPHLKPIYCSASCISTYVIDPEGYFYKCWNDIGFKDRSIFNILNVDKVNSVILHHYLIDGPFTHEKCRECKFLPICMGGCPTLGRENKCDLSVKAIDNIILEKYKQMIEKDN